MMEIIKWYSIVIVTIVAVTSFNNWIDKKDNTYLLTLISILPIIAYLVLR